MLYRLLADVTLVAHLLFIGFVVVGGLMALRWSRVAWVHLPSAIWGAWIELAGSICPLTPLENHFRRLGGQAGYEGGFIQHYLIPVIYPAELTREVQIALGGAVVALNLVAYALVLRRRKADGR